eukprot:CAMPEP_0183374020 /NCGR_PEP_ID=MMETSP0164_2-20130417/113235_1 /TAXON_ID=221442 /ORGANISM="Coccolithus pelagicus ssp braarudi, Strain PLY182g" /LENGTH=147 /DNA_ID=CAMNT_0025550997 /DNA_START=249 /DNA_END=691 /DNA_ORIENTATION=+
MRQEYVALLTRNQRQSKLDPSREVGQFRGCPRIFVALCAHLGDSGACCGESEAVRVGPCAAYGAPASSSSSSMRENRDVSSSVSAPLACGGPSGGGDLACALGHASVAEEHDDHVDGVLDSATLMLERPWRPAEIGRLSEGEECVTR